MDKKRKIIIIVLSILLVVLLGVGGYLFISYDKEPTKRNNDFGDSEKSNPNKFEGVSSAAGTTTFYATKEDVEKVINEQYTNSETTVKFTKEEDNCWYYTDNFNGTYSYCQSDGVINYTQG